MAYPIPRALVVASEGEPSHRPFRGATRYHEHAYAGWARAQINIPGTDTKLELRVTDGGLAQLRQIHPEGGTVNLWRGSYADEIAEEEAERERQDDHDEVVEVTARTLYDGGDES